MTDEIKETQLLPIFLEEMRLGTITFGIISTLFVWDMFSFDDFDLRWHLFIPTVSVLTTILHYLSYRKLTEWNPEVRSIYSLAVFMGFFQIFLYQFDEDNAQQGLYFIFGLVLIPPLVYVLLIVNNQKPKNILPWLPNYYSNKFKLFLILLVESLFGIVLTLLFIFSIDVT